MDLDTENARVFHDAVVAGRCIDCGETITGELGVRFTFDYGSRGLEIVVVDAKRNEIHPLARVELHLIPLARSNSFPLPPTGSA